MRRSGGKAGRPGRGPEGGGPGRGGGVAGGADGLATVRRLVCEVPRVLTAGGWLVMEVGAGQAAAVAALAAADGRWRGARRMRDHGGVERVVALARRGDAWTRS